MSILGNDLLLGSGDEGYNLTRSLRFRSSASASLSRTPSSTGDRQKWTWSGWVKRGNLGSNNCFFSQGNNIFVARFNNNTDVLEVYDVTGGPYQLQLITSQVFRDPSAWYHIVIATDTTQATAANRVKIYVNGSQVTAFSTATYYSQNYNTEINTTDVMNIGALAFVGQYFDGYLTEINFVNASQLTPSSFGETDTITGVWKPKRYAGTYGTNGFYLPFTDNSALTTSSNVGLGKDFSGNGNYWTTNNISITAGTTYDSMTDVPTLTSATAANFAVLNPLDKGSNNTLSNGNLQFQISSGTQGTVRSTFVLPSTGKWYWEVTMTALGPLLTGIATSAASLTNYVGSDAYGWGYNSGDGLVYNNGTTIRANATLAAGDIVGVAFDSGAGSLSFYKNNVFQSTAITGFTPSTVNYFMAAGTNGGAGIVNFGQRPFTYTPPTGYVALNTYNLPTSTIVKGNTVMDATLYNGTGGSQSIVNAGGFKPDFVWTKARSQADQNNLMDSVRGVGNRLFSNLTNAETTGGLVSVNSNGFSIDSSSASMNNSGQTYVGWQWQAGQGTTSSNTNGSITSTVSVNASAGFSVVTYTGNGTTGATVGHGLGVTPKWIIVKARSAVQDWRVYTETVGNTGVLTLNDTGAAVTNQSGFWNNTSPTSSVFSLGSAASTNGNGTTYVAYCWTPIAGYSAFGSYTGNGSTNGAFIYTAFKPRWVLVREVYGAGNWLVWDTARSTYNQMQDYLIPNSSSQELNNVLVSIDMLSNGFKCRTADDDINGNGNTYIYMAFAETPTKFSLAR